MTRLRSREAALRDNLAAQGLNSAAVSDIAAHNWAASTSHGHDYTESGLIGSWL
eukprot:SAG11_NODE_30476_length_300_cov_1.522388_1_plen_53_part_10